MAGGYRWRGAGLTCKGLAGVILVVDVGHQASVAVVAETLDRDQQPLEQRTCQSAIASVLNRLPRAGIGMRM
eukprot:3931584-Rhodomonas_salina.2